MKKSAALANRDTGKKCKRKEPRKYTGWFQTRPCLRAHRTCEIEVFIHDVPILWRIAGNSNEKRAAGLYWPLTQEPLAWAARKDDYCTKVQ